MKACLTGLVLLVIVGVAAGNSQQLGAVQNAKPIPVADTSKSIDCAAPNSYSVAEVLRGGARYVDIAQGDTVLGSIRIFSDVERNGFALDEARKTKTGFEISVEYGSRYYYHKRFIFICKRHKFYLRKVIVDSFDKHNPEHWWTKVIRVKPILPLEKFFLDDFMLEGVVK